MGDMLSAEIKPEPQLRLIKSWTDPKPPLLDHVKVLHST